MGSDQNVVLRVCAKTAISVDPAMIVQIVHWKMCCKNCYIIERQYPKFGRDRTERWW